MTFLDISYNDDMKYLEKLYIRYEEKFGSFLTELNDKEILIWQLGYSKPRKPSSKWYIFDWIWYSYQMDSWECRVTMILFYAEMRNNIDCLLLSENGISRILGRLISLNNNP